ncbi:hypothetical protein HDU92_006707 [Lobulomyces angularis]|nr:hypothetical protein HDU92_006707 [Lobulomyces angularis]
MFEKIEVTKKYEQDMMNNKKLTIEKEKEIEFLKRKYEAEVDKNSKLEAAVVALQREKLVLESNLRTQTARVKSLGVENDQLIDAHKELEKKLILVEADNIRQIEGNIELDFNIGNTLIPVYEVLKNECGNGKILQSLTKLIGESKVEGFLMKKFGQHFVSDKNQVLISSKLLINDILHNTIRYFYYKIGLGLQIAQDYDDIQKNKGKYFKFIITGLKLNLKNTLSSIFSKHYSSEMADALSNLLDATLDFLFLTNIFYSQIQMKFSNGNLQYNKENMILKKDFCGKEEKKKYISVCPALIDANTQKYLEKEIVISYI